MKKKISLLCGFFCVLVCIMLAGAKPVSAAPAKNCNMVATLGYGNVMMDEGTTLDAKKCVGYLGEKEDECPYHHKRTYKSSKKSVATVSSKGIIKAKKTGKTTITITCGKQQVKVKVTVIRKSKALEKQRKSLEKEIDRLYKDYRTPSSVTVSNCHKVIARLAKLESRSFMLGYRFCDTYNLEKGQYTLPKVPTAHTRSVLGDLFCDDEVVYPVNGQIHGYILYKNGWKMNRVAKNVMQCMAKLNPYDEKNQNGFVPAKISSSSDGIQIELKKKVSKEQYLGSLMFNSCQEGEDSAGDAWSYLLPQKDVLKQKITCDLVIVKYEQDSDLTSKEYWEEQRNKNGYAAFSGSYQYGDRSMTFTRLTASHLKGSLKLPLTSGKYVLCISPVSNSPEGFCIDMESYFTGTKDAYEKYPHLAVFTFEVE